MAQFTNQATLSYNGNVINSNIARGELTEVLSATKTAIMDEYVPNDVVTFVISIVNSGSTPFNGLQIEDNMGSYAFGASFLCPLTFVADSVRYYSNGVLQTAPTTITAGPPLVISPITVPAGGNVTVIYKVNINHYAPLGTTSTIENSAEISGIELSTPITVTSTISAVAKGVLTISKCISPTTVTENGRITYTFTIENTGNTAIADTDCVILTDTFDPVLSALAVTFKTSSGTSTWTDGTEYTYTGGVFSSNVTTGTPPVGYITVNAATYTQDATTGVWSITPGSSTLVITGTV